MTLQRLAWCFLHRSATAEAVGTALAGYEPAKTVAFAASGEDAFEATGPGFAVRVTAVRKLKPLLVEVRALGQRLADLRACSMVLTVDFAIDRKVYPSGSLLGARAPFGPELDAVPWEAVVACEALNIGLAAYRPITYDRHAGFYPEG